MSTTVTLVITPKARPAYRLYEVEKGEADALNNLYRRGDTAAYEVAHRDGKAYVTLGEVEALLFE